MRTQSTLGAVAAGHIRYGDLCRSLKAGWSQQRGVGWACFLGGDSWDNSPPSAVWGTAAPQQHIELNLPRSMARMIMVVAPCDGGANCDALRRNHRSSQQDNRLHPCPRTYMDSLSRFEHTYSHIEMDRHSLLRKLVTTGHLNVAERRELGTITRSEIVEDVKQSLAQNGIFPPIAGNNDDSVYEGAHLLNSNGVYSGIIQRHHPLNPSAVAESTTKRFHNVVDAVEWYIDYEWGDAIGGIPIEP